MKKKVIAALFLSSLVLSFASSMPVYASDDKSDISIENEANQGQPLVFENVTDISQVVEQIDRYYEESFQFNPLLRAAEGTKWKEGRTEYIGQDRYYVYSYHWIKGSSMSSWNIVGRAQRAAVTTAYGSVNNNTVYKMETRQQINSSPQTSGAVTVAAKAWVHGRD